MFHKKWLPIFIAAVILLSSLTPTVQALTVTEAVNSTQAAPSASLPSVSNPRGNIGYIIANIFYGSSDGAKNGKIKWQYLDVAGVNIWTESGSNAYFSYTGSIGIGTSTPSTSYKLDVVGGIRASNGLTVSAGSVSLPAGSISVGSIAQNGCTTNQVLKMNGSGSWVCGTDVGITGYTETDPVWTAASGSYYTKTNMQTSGQSQLHWGNLTNVPSASTATAGIVMLENSTGSTLTTKAATANMIKVLWDKLITAFYPSGTPTTNYIAKFDTGNTLTNSQIFDNGTNLGIGTNTPGAKLEVNGDIKLSGTTPSYRLTNVAAPVDNNDAANKIYVDSKVSAAGGSASSSPYLEDGSYYSEGGDPYFCRLNVLAGTSQRIISVNQNKLCDSSANLYCNAGSCNASSSILNDIKQNYQLIAAKDNQSCSINDGQVYCWGYTGNGQKYLDMSLSNTYSWHACALVSNGQIKCWWQNTYGQLGNGNTSIQYTPVAVSGISNAVKVIASNNGYSASWGDYGYTCALLSNGQMRCWGYNGYGQLGDGTTTTQYTPVTVSGISNAVDFSIAGHTYPHACAVLADGTVKCWGYNNYGQLGNGNNTNQYTPVTVSWISNAVNVFTSTSAYSTEYGFSCAILSDGTVKCWGYNGVGQLGNGNTTTSNVPVTVTGLSNVADLSIAGNQNPHVCAVLTDGQVKCWGYGGYGQLGNSASSSSSIPVTVTGITNAVKVYTGNQGYSTPTWYSCALLSSGQIKCWGYGGYGQLWNGGWSNSNTPVTVSGISNAIDMSLSSSMYWHWCAVLADGQVKCWGYNDYGQLWNGNTTQQNSPVVVSGINNAVKVFTASERYSTSYGYSCAILSDGQIKCWGHGGQGQLWNWGGSNSNIPVTVSNTNGMYYSGVGSVTVDKTVPQLKEGITAATSVVTGSYHACAIEGGAVRCWWFNAEGQLWNNSTTSTTAPVGVFGISTAKQLAAGYMHTCAVLTDGTVKCWGLNSEWQLWNGSTVSSTTPVAVSGITNAKEISAWDYHTCATLTDGTVKCWGLNTKWQLGIGSINSHFSSTPQTASGLTNISRIASGDTHNCAVTGSGATYCWGSGNWGQLGNGNYVNYLSTPSVVSGIATATRIGAGWNHTCIVQSDNTMKCWWLNGTSQQASTSYFATNTPASLLWTQNILTMVGWALHSCVISTDLGNLNCFGGNTRGQLGNGNMNTTSNLALVTYPVDNSSGVANYTLALCETRDAYNGNLWGVDGANAICQTQCGQGYKFGREVELANFNLSAVTQNWYWIDRAQNNNTNCVNWTDSSSGINGSVINFYRSDASVNYISWQNIVKADVNTCNNSRQLLCIRGVR